MQQWFYNVSVDIILPDCKAGFVRVRAIKYSELNVAGGVNCQILDISLENSSSIIEYWIHQMVS